VTFGVPVNVPSGLTVDLRVIVTITGNVSQASESNIRIRIGDVVGTADLPLPLGAVDIAEVDDLGQDILTDPAAYIRSDLTNIRSASEDTAFNYPNPFNPTRQTTNIVFYTPSTGSYTIKIFTITGKIVRTIKGNVTAAGSVEVTWDGKNGRGQIVRNGVYVAIILPPGGGKQTVKIAVVK
jgi:hypothetical protein